MLTPATLFSIIALAIVPVYAMGIGEIAQVGRSTAVYTSLPYRLRAVSVEVTATNAVDSMALDPQSIHQYHRRGMS